MLSFNGCDLAEWHGRWFFQHLFVFCSLILFYGIQSFSALYFHCRGRKITSSGRRDLDQVAGRIVIAA